MNNLQLYISKYVRDSASTLAEINPSGAGRRAVVDMRQVLALTDYPVAERNIFYVIVNLTDGYAIHVIRTIPPARLNHLDAVIYVDGKLDIMADELLEVVNYIAKIVSAKSVSEEDMTTLKQIFAREYDIRDSRQRVKLSHGQDYAYLTFGDNSGLSLADIFRAGIFRNQWSEYKAVCILGENIRPNNGSMVSLDSQDDESDNQQESQFQSAETKSAYIFSIPIHTPVGNTDFEFEIESDYAISKSPIKGYRMSQKPAVGKVTHLQMSGRSTFKQILRCILWGVGGFVTGVIVMAITGYFEESSDGRQSTTSVSATADNSKSPVATTKAVRYLDDKKVWSRDEMEQIDGLSGLFDDLNNYRFDKISDYWATSLASSRSFARVVKAARGAMSKNVDPRRDENDHNPRYNRDGDTALSWLGYTYWIDPKL